MCGHPADFYTTETRTAHKAHRCHECGQAIAAGQRYASTACVMDGEWRHYKTCSACWDVFETMTEAGWCVAHGSVREDYAEYLREG